MNKYKKWLMKMAEPDSVPNSPNCGICTNFDNEFGEPLPEMDLKEWPSYSGDSVFPIEGYHGGYNPNGHWLGKRGELRRDLCKFIAEKYFSNE